MTYVLYIALAFVAGCVAALVVQHYRAVGAGQEAVRQSRAMLERAEREATSKKQEILLKAKEEAEAHRREFDKEAEARQRDLAAIEDRLNQREELIEDRQRDLAQRETELREGLETVDQKKTEFDGMLEREKVDLEKISGMTREEAKGAFLDRVGSELDRTVAIRIGKVEKRFREESIKKAREILSEAVQRCSASYEFENIVSVVTLPNDELKGHIIGKEGRNIKVFEAVTGMNLIIDETPETVVISGFNALKREIARVALEKLLHDGHITPQNIERLYEKARKETLEKAREIGKNAVKKAKIGRVHPEMLMEIGKFHYRASYGQNLLQHCFEVSNLATILAHELGADPFITRRAAFLHDLGKVSDSDAATHSILGMQLAKKLGEKPIVCNAIGAHHLEIEQLYVESVIVEVADTLSAARPGARRDTLESYIKRIEGLETIAKSYEGVHEAYAIQAGREVRVIVNPQHVDDETSGKLAYDIARRIENEMDYPGQVKVVVVRETRASDMAH
ncbi:MAG: ribonuclease Y [Candidatus Wallbacteria bacterium]|nr:ribonuclease Y [Candidatus Wallbacteria bacterium]